MNKIYMLATLFALLLSAFSQQVSAQETLSLDIEFTDTTPATIDGFYCGGNIEIATYKIEPRDVTNQCFGALGQISRSSLYLNGDVDYKNGEFSYLLIKNHGGLDISRVVVTGMSNAGSAANLTAEFSEVEDPTENDYEIDDLMVFPADAIGVKCGDNETGGGGYWPAGIKVIRFMHSNRYTSMNTINPPRPCIQAIQIYTEGAYTSVPKVSEESFEAYMVGNELNLSEYATQVFVYTISGILVQTAIQVQNMSLDMLPSGMYVVKATNGSGKRLVTKIIR